MSGDIPVPCIYLNFRILLHEVVYKFLNTTTLPQHHHHTIKMATSLSPPPVKTVQLEGKVIAITGANRGM